jgi:signal transduction histidine kinase
VGTLASVIAHAFNNILDQVFSNLSLARDQAEPGSELEKHLEKSQRACRWATELTNQLDSFGSSDAASRETVDLSELLRKAVAFALKGSFVTCDVNVAEDLRPIHADPVSMKFALAHLINNCDQAMPEGGTIQVGAANVQLDENSELSLPPGEFVKITISDLGGGIPDESAPRIFDPYRATGVRWSGLQLSLAHHTITSHGGLVTIEAESGVGSTFSVYLPAEGAS